MGWRSSALYEGAVFIPYSSLLEKSLEKDLTTPILDIEDLVKAGGKYK